MKRLLRSLLILSLLAAAGAFYLSHAFTRPGPLDAPKTIVLTRGQGFNAIAGALKREGVIANEMAFKAGALALRQQRRFKAGEYLFPPGISAREVAEMLAEGKTVIRKFTVPEGKRVADILKALNEEQALSGEVVSHIQEGSLLPETYHYSYGDARSALLARMREGMAKTLAALWEKRTPGLPFTTAQEALILASIVEKETGVPEERGRVAAVFLNRLKKGMRLQSDPTTLYAIESKEGPLGRALTTADLQRDLPHNTYVVPGLPPTPIACPGREALEAVLNPPQTDELYFVATGLGDGRHYFARTLEEHNANVAKYRAQMR